MITNESTVLITGASGFLGRNLMEYLGNKGMKAIAVFRPSSNNWRFNDSKFNSITAELDDAEFWELYFSKTRITHILHLATFGSYPNQTDPYVTVDTNLLKSLKFLEVALRCKTLVTFVSAGSASEYDPITGKSAETDIGNPANIYGATKTAFGMVGSQLAKIHSKNFVHARLFTMYGPWEDPNRIFPRLITHALIGKFPPMSNPSTARDFFYIDDALEFFYAVIKSKKSFNLPLNVGSGISTSLETLTNEIKTKFRLNVDPIWGEYPSRNFDQAEWTCTTDRALETFGWKSKITISDGISRFTKWISDSNNKYYKT